ncbi:MAG TPA: DNA repair protein RadC [Aggregatilineales bacterium]|nr:DNA repair protein RadC [Aggregatilineales bacterium]
MTEPIYSEESLRERLMQEGAGSLSDSELISILLRAGNRESDVFELAEKLLEHFGGLRELARLSYNDLTGLPDNSGLRPAQAALIITAIELARRLNGSPREERPIIQSAADAADLLSAEMEALKQEHLRVILLDIHRRVMAIPTIYIGSINTTVIRAAEVFREAISRNAASVILVHNHPSGDATPSASDITVTEILIAAGRLLDIGVLDHLIIGQGAWVSLRDTGVDFLGDRFP